MVALEEHHIKYKELDGIDETIMMSVSEHRKLHIRNGFHVPRHIVVKAHQRTQKYREVHRLLYAFCFSTCVEPGWSEKECIDYNPRTGKAYIHSYFRYNPPFAVPRGSIESGRKTLPDEPILKKLPWM